MSVSTKYKKEIGAAIRKKRERAGISQRKLALNVEITNVALSDIENGNIFPSDKVFLRILEKLFSDDLSLKEKLSKKYAQAKGTIPPDIAEYLGKKPEVIDLLRIFMHKNTSNEKILKFKNQLQGSDGV